VTLERERLLAQSGRQGMNPDPYLEDLARKAFYVSHPYSVDVDGTVEAVSSLTGATLKTVLQRSSATSNMLLVCRGEYDSKEVESDGAEELWPTACRDLQDPYAARQ